MILGELIVHGGGGALPAVGGVAFDDGTIHRLHELADQLRPQIVAAGFTGGDFHGDVFARRLAAERFIHRH